MYLASLLCMLHAQLMSAVMIWSSWYSILYRLSRRQN